MNTYCIMFSGGCEIEADSREEAKEKFWNEYINQDKPLPQNIYDIDGIALVKKEIY